MSELLFNSVFQDVSHMFRDQAFSTMYFGRHHGKNLLILKHDLTVMIVLGDDLQWSSPELIKAVSFRGENRMRGTQIVGSENVVLFLDEYGCLWRLVNAFDVSTEKTECFHSLKEECFYEWIPFKKFNLVKVLAITAMEQGFACLGLNGSLKRKLMVLSSFDSTLEEYTFEELNTSKTNSFNYYLTSLNTQSSIFENKFKSPSSEVLLITDRLSGKTYMCANNGKNWLLNVSQHFLISALHFQKEKCILLCFENGKLIFNYYNESERQCVAYLSDKLVFVDKCCCPDSCVLWSNGISINHTKLMFNCGEDIVKLSHLKVNCCVQRPLSLLKINQHVLAVTINNFYYHISTGIKNGKEIRKPPDELLSEICKGSSLTWKLEEKTYMLAHYLECKDVIQNNNIRGNTKINWEGNFLAVKSCLGISLREELWKIHLTSTKLHKKSVHVTDLEADMSKDAIIIIENPFKSKCRVKVNLIGEFNDKDLFLDLGETDELEENLERNYLSKQINEILKNRRKFHVKGS